MTGVQTCALPILEGGKITPLFQTTLVRDPALATTPTLLELASSDDARAVISFEARAEEIGFYLMAPPGVPAERIAVLREAFAAMAHNPDYLAEAKNLNMGTNFLGGAELQNIAAAEAATPSVIVESFKAAAAFRR